MTAIVMLHIIIMRRMGLITQTMKYPCLPIFWQDCIRIGRCHLPCMPCTCQCKLSSPWKAGPLGRSSVAAPIFCDNLLPVLYMSPESCCTYLPATQYAEHWTPMPLTHCWMAAGHRRFYCLNTYQSLYSYTTQHVYQSVAVSTYSSLFTV
jgi:hypothetical protein